MNAIIEYQPNAVSPASDFMPLMDISTAVERRNLMVNFVKKIMVPDVDFGKIPGVDKPTLLKPGAEKLVTFFGLSPEFTVTESEEDWTGARHGGEPFFYYRYRCTLSRPNRVIGTGEGSCNSWESKYRYRWVPEAQVPEHLDKATLARKDATLSEFKFSVDKAETSGKYGKPQAYWDTFRAAIEEGNAREVQRTTKTGKVMTAWEIPSVSYRVPNPDVADVVNTIQKMSQKRALVAAVLIGVNASEFFTQDVEEFVEPEHPFTPKQPVPEQATPAEPRFHPESAEREALRFNAKELLRVAGIPTKVFVDRILKPKGASKLEELPLHDAHAVVDSLNILSQHVRQGAITTAGVLGWIDREPKADRGETCVLASLLEDLQAAAADGAVS